jgi:hypothetical protein
MIEEAHRCLGEALGYEGKTAVILLQAMVENRQASTLPAGELGSALRKSLADSLRPSDLVIQLEAGTVMVFALGIASGQAAQDLIKKVYATAGDFCRAQYPEIFLALKAGGLICAQGESSRRAWPGCSARSGRPRKNSATP